MSLRFFKENLPWIASSAAIVFAASGYFDRGLRTQAAPETVIEQVQPVQAAAAPLVGNGVVAQTSQDQVVARADTGIGTSLTSPITSQNQPTFTDTQPTAVATLGAVQGQLLGQPAVQPQPTQQVASFESNPAAFFKDAQASLNAANSCKDDLRALAAQARVYFPSGGLTAEEAGLSQARLIGTVMQGCKGVGILVTGHSDPSGDPAVNLRLSQKRAELVIQRISASCIDTSSFVPQGFGDRQPSTATGSKTRAYYDRRVEFSVVDLQTNASFTTASTQSTFTPSCVARLEKAVQKTKLYYSPLSIAAPAADLDTVLQLAKQASACPQARLRIIGQHTDETWANEDFNTGILRAKALMSILVGQGIASNQVIIAAPFRSVGVEGQPQLSKSRVDFDVIQEPS
ncbi:MAG: OmpA family protein [Ascidiaceihabitans sp.]|nr:OmpA family protein [Ascidiaceihabitans sp.]